MIEMGVEPDRMVALQHRTQRVRHPVGQGHGQPGAEADDFDVTPYRAKPRAALQDEAFL